MEASETAVRLKIYNLSFGLNIDFLHFLCLLKKRNNLQKSVLSFCFPFPFFPKYLSFPSLFSLFLPFEDVSSPNPVVFTASNVNVKRIWKPIFMYKNKN